MKGETMFEPHNCRQGSAWHTWQTAGYEWRQQTWATSKGALLLAANAFASNSGGDLERDAKKRAFIEGANLAANATSP